VAAVTEAEKAVATAIEAEKAEAEKVAAAEAEKAAAAAEKAAEAEKLAAARGVSEVLDATVADDTAAPALSELEENTYDPDKYRDTTRSYIAYWLLGLLTIVVIFSFIALVIINKGTVIFADLKSLLELLLGPIVALVSAATGFYFGSQQSTNAKKP
jgi:cobalamin biosynthesis Mg chelatase CobN